jgi:hypothetical protein
MRGAILGDLLRSDRLRSRCHKSPTIHCQRSVRPPHPDLIECHCSTGATTGTSAASVADPSTCASGGPERRFWTKDAAAEVRRASVLQRNWRNPV